MQKLERGHLCPPVRAKQERKSLDIKSSSEKSKRSAPVLAKPRTRGQAEMPALQFRANRMPKENSNKIKDS